MLSHNPFFSSSAFSRAAASRKSIKLSEGLKISPMPTKFNKRSGIILPKSNEYFEVAVAQCQPLILERTQELNTPKNYFFKHCYHIIVTDCCNCLIYIKNADQQPIPQWIILLFTQHTQQLLL